MIGQLAQMYLKCVLWDGTVRIEEMLFPAAIDLVSKRTLGVSNVRFLRIPCLCSTFRIINTDCWLSYPMCCKMCMKSCGSGEKRTGPWRKSCKAQRPLAILTVKVPGGLWLQSLKQTYSYFHWIFQLNHGVSSRKAGLLHKIQSGRTQKVVRSWRHEQQDDPFGQTD